MRRVAIRTLKTRLSEFVGLARRGERIVVTHLGQDVAELGPLDPDVQAAWQLAAEGKASWEGGSPRGLEDGVPIRGPAISDTISQGREERS